MFGGGGGDVCVGGSSVSSYPGAKFMFWEMHQKQTMNFNYAGLSDEREKY